jgi:hypothetical protein
VISGCSSFTSATRRVKQAEENCTLPPRIQKARNRNVQAASQRWPEIREHIDQYIQSLIELYEETDPARGDASEEDKLERARQAISIWWYLYGELLLWAQSQIAGYEFGRSNPDFMENLSKILGYEITADSHVLEYIGLGWSLNRVNSADPMMEKVEAKLEEFKAQMDVRAIRSLIRELLDSRSANSSFWRFELRSALFALNIGHVDEILKPEPIRRQGDPLQLFYCKLMALRHVYFHIGKGLKKIRALQLVADELGQSTETLRSWEKFMSHDEDLIVELDWSRLAGELESDLDKHSVQELIKLYGARYNRHTADVEWAATALKLIRSTPLKQIRDDLRRGRIAKRSGS